MRRGNRRYDVGDSRTRHQYDRHSDVDHGNRSQQIVHERNFSADDNRFRGDGWRHEQILESDERYWETRLYDDRHDGGESRRGGPAQEFDGHDKGREGDYYARESHGRHGDELYFPDDRDRRHDYGRGSIEDYGRAADFDDQHQVPLYDKHFESDMSRQERGEDTNYEREGVYYDDRSRDNTGYSGRERDSNSQNYSYRDANRAVLIEDRYDFVGQDHKQLEGDGRYDRRRDKDRMYEEQGSRQQDARNPHTDRGSGFLRGREDGTHRDLYREGPSGRETGDDHQKTRYHSSQSDGIEKSYRRDSSNQTGNRYSKSQQDRKKSDNDKDNRNRESQRKQERSRDQGHDQKRPPDRHGSGNKEEKVNLNDEKKNSRDRSNSRQRSDSFRNQSISRRDSSISRNSHSEKDGMGKHRSQDVKKIHRMSSHQSGHSDKKNVSNEGKAYAEEDVLNILADDDRFSMEANMYSNVENDQADQNTHRHSRDSERQDRHSMMKSETDAPFEIHADCSASIFEEKFKSPARTFDKSQSRLSKERHIVSNKTEDSSRHVRETRRNVPYDSRTNRSKQSGRFSYGLNKNKSWLLRKTSGFAHHRKNRNFRHGTRQARDENVHEGNDENRSLQNRGEQGGNRNRAWNRDSSRFRNRDLENYQPERSVNRQGVEQDRYAGEQRHVDSLVNQQDELENRYGEYGGSVAYDRDDCQRSGDREQAYSGNSHRALGERKSRIRGYTHYDRVKRKYFGRNNRRGSTWYKRNARHKQSAQRIRQGERDDASENKKDFADEMNREDTGINLQPVDPNQQLIFIPNAGFQGGQASMVDQFGTILVNPEMGIHPGEQLQQVTVPLANQGLEAPPGSEYIFIPFVNQVQGMPDSMASSGMDRRVVHDGSEGVHLSNEQDADSNRNQDQDAAPEKKKKPLTKQQLAHIRRKIILKRRLRLERQLEQKILKKLLGTTELSESLRKNVSENKPRLQLKRISPPPDSRGTSNKPKTSRRTTLEEVSDEEADRYDKVSDFEDVTDDDDYNRAEGGHDRRQTFRKPGEPRRGFRRSDQDFGTSGGDVRKVVEREQGRGRKINVSDRNQDISNRQTSTSKESVNQQKHSAYDDGLSNRRERAYEKGSMSPIQITVSNDRFSKTGSQMSSSQDNEDDGRKSPRFTRTNNERFSNTEDRLSSRGRNRALESEHSDSYSKGNRDARRNVISNKEGSSPQRSSRGRYIPKQGSTYSNLRNRRDDRDESRRNNSRDRDGNHQRDNSHTRDDELHYSQRRERPSENMALDRGYQELNRQTIRTHTEVQSPSIFQHNASYPSQQSIAQVQPQYSSVTSQSFPQTAGVQLLNPNINIDQSLPPVINMSQVSSQGVTPDMSLPPPARMPGLGDQSSVLIQQHALQQQQQQLLQQSLQQTQHFQPQVQQNQQFQQVTQQLQVPQQVAPNVQQYQGSLGGIQQSYIPSSIQQAVQSVQQSIGPTNPGAQILPVQTSQQLSTPATQLQQTLPMAGVQSQQGQFQIAQVTPSSTPQVLPSSQLNLPQTQIPSSQQSYVATTQHQAMPNAVGSLQQGIKSQQPVIGTVQTQLSNLQQGITGIKVPKGSLHFAQTNVKPQSNPSGQSYGAGGSDRISPSRYSRVRTFDYNHRGRGSNYKSGGRGSDYNSGSRGSDYGNYNYPTRNQEKHEVEAGEDEEDDAGELLCTKCEKVYLSDQVMRKHARWHDLVENGISDLRCDNCEQAFHSSSSLHSHISKMHTYDSWNCTVCDITLPSSGALVHHMRVKKHVSVMNKFCCSLCVASFKFIRQLISHRASVHSDKQGFRSHSFRRY